MGNLGRRLVYGTVYLTILANPIIFQLTSVESLQQIFYQRNVSSYVAGAIVAGIMLPLSQVRIYSRPALSHTNSLSQYRGHFTHAFPERISTVDKRGINQYGRLSSLTARYPLLKK